MNDMCLPKSYTDTCDKLTAPVMPKQKTEHQFLGLQRARDATLKTASTSHGLGKMGEPEKPPAGFDLHTGQVFTRYLRKSLFKGEPVRLFDQLWRKTPTILPAIAQRARFLSSMILPLKSLEQD
ncbi:hypothetical protein KIN20_011092 [Parelaphostrongylus tenuis]|uniref:Uncharacterized protein n=1 Tax=Parelaphostrongylus tenuis TaxID=148309 RepID=A0AAD5MT16_PARTN|nr:hypothetical protein KIN20_011092 [Parelaphostrongylus tenuis]